MTVTTLLMALFFLWVGVLCLHRPDRVQQWLVGFYKSNRPKHEAPTWMQSKGMALFIRVIGALCLVNFISQVYLLMHPVPPPD